MTVRLIEGFDHWTSFPFKGWTQFGTTGNGTVAFAAGRFGAGTGNGVVFNQGTGSLGHFKNLGGNYATLVVGCAVSVGAINGIGQRIFGLTDSGTEHLSLRLDTANRLLVSRNGTTLVTETNPVMQTSVWYYVELKVTFNGTTGTYAVRRNGAAVPGLADATGQNTIATANAFANEIRIAGFVTANNPPTLSLDDLYLFDTAGSTNNDFVGERRVYTIFPASAGTTTQLTNTGGASNAVSVSENPHTSDASYVSSATVGQFDTYTTADLPATTATVNAVQFNLVARNDDAGLRTIAPVQRTGGGATDGTATPPLVANYVDYQIIHENSLDTATAWTPTEINSSQFGVKVVS